MKTQIRQFELILQQEREHIKEIEKIKKSIESDTDINILPEENFEHLDL